jgi:hypothetical protein
MAPPAAEAGNKKGLAGGNPQGPTFNLVLSLSIGKGILIHEKGNA